MNPRVIVDPTTFLEVEAPSFASDQRALRRARRAASGDLAEGARITWSRHGEELYKRLLEEVWDDYEIEPGFRRLQ